LPSLPEIAENNVLDLEQNANGSEVLQEKPKKGKGRPPKWPAPGNLLRIIFMGNYA